MADKPSYDELLKRVPQLESDAVANCKKGEEILHRRDEILKAVAFSAEQYFNCSNQYSHHRRNRQQDIDSDFKRTGCDLE